MEVDIKPNEIKMDVYRSSGSVDSPLIQRILQLD